MSDLLLISSTVLESHNDMAFIVTLPMESNSPVGNKIIDAPVCKGNCKLDLAKLAGGPKLIYYDK